MATDTKTVESKVTQENIDLDSLFDGAAGADSVTVPEESKPKSVFSKPTKEADFSFTETEEEKEVTKEVETEASAEVDTEEKKADDAKTTENADDIFDALEVDEADEVEDKKVKRGRKKISGIGDVFDKLIKDDKIVPFDDDKSFDDYSAKDWEELIEANLEEKANQVRRETPKQFFESLPQELQIAARYVADGGTDLKGLFSTLAQAEEKKSLDVKKESDQEVIIRDYLQATGYGDAEEIAEEIEIWKDLGKLESQASKFKPKLDKMQEKVLAKKLEEQEMRKAQQEQASKQYMENVYNTLKEGSLGELKVDRKTQSMLYNGLVQPNYPSVSGRNTNLLGHLLEKYQFVEPNYTLISEALWLLSDPNGYKTRIMEKGAQKSVESTVRKLKTEQSNSGGSSLGVQERETEGRKKSTKKKLPRSNNIFKRF
tara:strand:+ start:3089 stop:4378 length:1290 start_codon:yes stop_codon:yes gene_type:complete